MNADPPQRRRGRRVLSPEERALWKTVTRTIAPLRAEPDAAVEPEVIVPAVPPPPAKRRSEPHVPPKPKVTPREPAPPPLAPLDHRQRRRIARGGMALDARLDLHGYTQDEAHSALRRFLRNAQADGARVVLVITGKGARAGYADHADHHGGRGVLKRLVPQWLRLPEFRSVVVGFEDAHVTHGGEGALYIRVRRTRDGRAE